MVSMNKKIVEIHKKREGGYGKRQGNRERERERGSLGLKNRGQARTAIERTAKKKS